MTESVTTILPAVFASTTASPSGHGILVTVCSGSLEAAATAVPGWPTTATTPGSSKTNGGAFTGYSGVSSFAVWTGCKTGGDDGHALTTVFCACENDDNAVPGRKKPMGPLLGDPQPGVGANVGVGVGVGARVGLGEGDGLGAGVTTSTAYVVPNSAEEAQFV